MQFNSAPDVESLVWQLRLADWPRSKNRSKINDLFNGLPPYTDEEVRANGIAVNVNPLGGTRLAHDGRSQFSNAFMKPGKFFGARTDYGPVHKRNEYSTVVTRESNRIMKRSSSYFETLRSKFALLILHGIGPATWDNRDSWCPDEVGVEDVLIPANTTLKMKNLPFFAIYKSYTGAQLRKLTSGPKVDPAWNMPLVDYMIKWVDEEGSKLLGTTWPEVWSPEKMGERIKGDGGLYASDAVPTINCYDFYFWADEGKHSGWNRRIVLDAFGTPGAGGIAPQKGSNIYGDEAKGFLYNPKNRVYGNKLSELISFQFADLSAVAPFRYHSVRSLGFLLWAVCHLQNRLYCKGMEATFEQLTQYMRVKSMEDVERALKVELVNRGFIDESIQFIPAAERWQTNIALLEYAYGQNDRIINENSSSWVQNQDYSRDRVEKTKFQVQAEVNAATTLVSSGLLQAYQYQTFEYREIFRRFCRKNSRDAGVREFRNSCLRQGVPEKVLVPEAFDISSEQVMGSGNKTLEMQIAQQLLEMRNLYDPEPQRKILRDVTLAITDNAAMTEELVPEKPAKVTDSVHDAQLAAGSLMLGLPVAIKSGINHMEYIETLLSSMATIMHRIEQTGSMATQQEIIGLQNMGQNIGGHIQILAQDEGEKDKVKQYGDELGQLMNLVKGYQQRLQQKMQKEAEAQQASGGGVDAETAAKLKGKLMLDEAKAQNMLQSHASRTSQKQIQFELAQEQKAKEHQAALERTNQQAQVDLHQQVAESSLDLQRKAAENAMDLEKEKEAAAIRKAAPKGDE